MHFLQARCSDLAYMSVASLYLEFFKFFTLRCIILIIKFYIYFLIYNNEDRFGVLFNLIVFVVLINGDSSVRRGHEGWVYTRG